MDGILTPEISRLSDLAYNLWFAGNENAKQLFQLIDENKWEETKHNPVRLLLDTSHRPLVTAVTRQGIHGEI